MDSQKINTSIALITQPTNNKNPPAFHQKSWPRRPLSPQRHPSRSSPSPSEKIVSYRSRPSDLSTNALSSVRDNYDSKKEDYEAQISELLGTKWVINISPQELWAYVTDNNSTASYVLNGYYNFASASAPTESDIGHPRRYVDGFIYGLKSFLEKYEDEGKTYFNKAVTQSELTVTVNPKGDDVSARYGTLGLSKDNL